MFEVHPYHLFKPFSIFKLQFSYHVSKIAQFPSFFNQLLVIPCPLVSFSSSESSNYTITKALKSLFVRHDHEWKKFEKQHNCKQ